PAFTRNDDVRVFVVRQKRRDAIHDVANVSIDQHAAVARYVVGEWQLRKIADGPGEQHATQRGSNANPARALVCRGGVSLTLRIIKLVLSCFYVDVTIRELAVIDFRTSDFDFRAAGLNGHV